MKKFNPKEIKAGHIPTSYSTIETKFVKTQEEKTEREYLKTSNSIKAMVEEMSMEIQKLSNTIEILKKNNALMVNKNREIKALIEIKQENLKALHNQREKDNEKIKVLEKQLEISRHKGKLLAEKLFQIKEGRMSLINKLKTAEEYIEETKEINKKIKNEENEIDSLNQHIKNMKDREIELKEDIANQVKTLSSLKFEMEKLEVKIGMTNNQIEIAKNATTEEKKTYEKLQKEEEILRHEMEKKKKTLTSLENELIESTKHLNAEKNEFEKEKVKHEILKKEYKTLNTSLEEDIKLSNIHQNTITKLQDDLAKIVSENKKKEELLTNYKEQVKKKAMEKNMLEKRIQKLEDAIVSTEKINDKDDAEINKLEKNIASIKRTIVDLDNIVQDTRKQQSIKNNELQKICAEKELQTNILKISNKKVEAITKNFEDAKKENTKLQKLIEKNEKEATDFYVKNFALVKQLKLIFRQIQTMEYNLQESNRQTEEQEKETTKLKKQYEQLTIEKNQYLRSYLESKIILEQYQEKEKLISDHIIKLEKELYIQQENFDQEKLEIKKRETELKLKEKEIIEQTNCTEKIQNKLSSLRNKYNLLINELNNKKNILDEIKKQREQNIRQMQIAETKLDHANKETNIWKKKLCIQSLELRKETKYFKDQKERISVMKGNLSELMRENKKLNRKNSNIFELQYDLTSVYTKFFEQKRMAKILEEQMRNPTNIHQWRILEDSDPENFALIKMNQILKHELVSKNTEIKKNTMEIKEKNRMMKEMKTIALRQCDFARLKQNLEENQMLLKQKYNQIKSLNAERDHLFIRLKKEKQENEKLRNQLKNLKTSIWLMRKKPTLLTIEQLNIESITEVIAYPNILQLPPITETDETIN